MRKETLLLLSYINICYPSWLFSDTSDPEPIFFHGELMPVDPDVCTTQNITFTCTLLDPPKTNHSIGFIFKNPKSTNGQFVAVDKTRVRVVNETVSQFTMHNVTTSANYIFVGCQYWEVFGDMNISLQLGELTAAGIYPTPEQVQDFNCVVINYNAMKCSWKYGKEYGGKFPEISFKWGRSLTSSLDWNDCPSTATTKEGYCKWNSTRDGYFENSIITFNLSLKQKGCAKITSQFEIDTSKIVKPSPVVSLAAATINSTCILVSWKSTESEPHSPKEHKVIVHKVLESNTKEIDEIRFNSTKENENRTVCNLHPYTRYRFSVSIQPIGIYSGYYSDERNASAKTYSAKPSASPEITEGGFSWQPRGCQRSTQRRVCTFWKQIKEEDMNGEILGLHAVFTPNHSQTRSITREWAKDVIYECANLKCDTSYSFSIKARNTNGTFENAEQLEIPAATPELMQPLFVVESANGSEVYVNLSNTETLTARGFTVAWCRNENGECENRHEIQWKTFPSSPIDVVIQIDSSNARDFLYGVSALSDRGGSGMDWQDCVYQKLAELKREPQNVIVGQGSEDNALTVTWDKLSCMSGDPYIDRYGIQYQNLKDRDKKSIEVSALAEARIVLVGLEEDQPYEVTVRGITIDGNHGPKSQPNTGTPFNRSLKPGATVGISMGVLVCVMFAGVGCFCAIRRCKNKAKKAIKEAGNITIPDNGDLDVNTSLGCQESCDSGYDMTPPADKCPDSVKFSNIEFIRPDDYHFVTEWKGSKEGMNTDISKLDPLLFGPFPDRKGISRNSKEPSDILRESSRKMNHILDIHKPLAFINHSESEISCEESNETESVKEKSIDYYVTTKNVSINNSEHSKEKQNGLLHIPSPLEDWSESDLKIDVKNTAKLPDKLEDNQNYIIAIFDNDKYAKGISRDNARPLDVAKLLTQTPCPQEVNSSMLSSSDRKIVGDKNDCELSNRQVPHCSVGYVTSVVHPTPKNTKAPQSSTVSATQTPRRLSDTTSNFQKHSVSNGNVSTVSTFNQYVSLTNSGQKFTPRLHATGNNGYIPAHVVEDRVSVSAVGGYVPHCALENISDQTSVNDNTGTVSIDRNIEKNNAFNVFSSPDSECDIPAKSRSLSNVDTVDDKFQSNNVASVVSKSPEYFIHPEPDTYVHLNQHDIQSKSNADVESIHSQGYVDEKFANVPLKKAMDTVKGTDTSKPLKSESDGYVGHSVLENFSRQLNVQDYKKLKSDGYIRNPKIVHDHNAVEFHCMPIVINDDGI